MALAAGTRLGPFEIVAPIGAGGMGDVYRARDTRLNRDVAIKVLPDLFANDPERFARFRREAQMLASLNHPNIAHIHGLEDSGGVHALVMELVEGEDLAERLRRGAIPLDEALPVATQIIEALAAAHERGIVHRDLKPANIKLQPDGMVKVLDFGLAKAIEPVGIAVNVSQSPTITTPAMMTGLGVILGTAAYMAPEQARGKAVDKRADIWAFGCVLYEMLTGTRAFEGNTVSDTLAAVLKTEPDWGLLPPDTPASITRLLRRCLQKDAVQRLHDIADARLEISGVGVESPSGHSADTARARRRERLVWASAVAVLGLSAVAAIAWALRPKPPPPLMRLEIATPPTTDLPSLAISPDGRTIAFVASFEGRPRLWLRPLDATTARPLPGTDDARDPFWSPDSRSIGFFAAGHLKRMDVEGGSPRVLANVVSGALGVGGASWGRDGTILYAPAQTSSSIYRVSSNGGQSTAVTRPVRGGFYSLPQFLPDGRQFMYSVVMSDVAESADHRGVFVGRIDGAEPRRLLDADAAWYSAGYLLFVRQGALFAQRFDPLRLSLEGRPWTLADPVVSPTIGTRPAVSTSDAGLVIFRAGSGVRQRQFEWFDRSGAEIAKVGEPIPNGLNPSLSPDGRLVAMQAEVDANVDIWLLEADRGLLNRFTTDPTVEAFPIWSPDGNLLVFNSIRAGGNDLYQKPVDGSAPETLLLETSEIKQPCDWSPDGRFLLYRSRDRAGPGFDLWALPMSPGGKPFPVVKTKFNETDGQFSPDSLWIAYQSDESGRSEIYVQPFSGVGGRQRVSMNGGAQVRWRHDGRELFYIALDGRLMAVPVRLISDSRRVEVGAPVPLFATRIGGAAATQIVLRQQYVASADGQRFLMSTVPDVTSSTTDYRHPELETAIVTVVLGTRLGAYEIGAPIGAGGMGEVYRGRDTRLNRDVAIKVLPDLFANDPERLARFRREAQMLASLNHPNIAHIHGLEDSGGVHALVMELVEGEDLAERLRRGAIPLDEALPVATQIIEALAAAHERGIVHRDLKPANIKLQPDGMVKVLDFGLAKAIEPVGIAVNVSQSPTITTPAMMTGLGVILGTAAYMAPEQARGKAVDKRADIWAFGCVFYEMLTGTRAFAGDEVSDVLASVLAKEPDWTRLPSDLSPILSTYIKRCLQKDPKQRIADAQDVRLALDGAFETSTPHPRVPMGASAWRIAALASAAALLVGAVVATMMWLVTRPAPPRVSRLSVGFSTSTTPSVSGFEVDLAITRDGSRLAYVGNNSTQLFVRALDELEARAVFTGAPAGPFVSPDGQWIGFVDGITELKRVSLSGGPAVTLATLDGSPRGATWGPDDTIIVATSNLATGLQRVGAQGGPATVLTRPDRSAGELDHVWPELLPGGRGVLFTVTALTGGLDAARVEVLDLLTGRRTVVVRGGSHAHYVSSGHLVYAAAGALRAVAFDLSRLATHGTAMPVVSDVATTRAGGIDAVVGSNGTLAYLSGGVTGIVVPRTFVWVDRQGRETPIPVPPRPYIYPRVSPDGTRIAMFAQDLEQDIWLWDLVRMRLTQATFHPGFDSFPVWTSDSRRLIFMSDRAGSRNLFWQAADGTGEADRLSESLNYQTPVDVSPDGRLLIFTETVSNSNYDVMQMTLDGTRHVTPLLHSPLIERNAVVSPDGRWLAYEANDSGRLEIYVRPFPEVNSGHWVVSTAGGTRPLWARSGEELFYLSPTGALMRVGVERGPTWAASTPTQQVREGYFVGATFNTGRTYDIAPDGQRFLMLKEATGSDQAATARSLIVVLNWAEELKRLVPTK